MPTGLNSVRYVIEAVDKVTSVYANIVKATEKVAKKHDVVNAVIRKSQNLINKLGNAVKGVAGRFDQLATKAKEGIGKVVSSLGGLGTALAGAFTLNMIKDVFNSLTRAASDLSGAIGMSQDTFGKYFGTIEALAQKSSDSIGMSKSEVYKAANGFGIYFKSIGYGAEQSAQLSAASIKLVQDLASARGMTNDDALTTYQDALNGNSEAARKLGVVVDDAKLRQRAFEMGLVKSAKDTIPSYVRSQAAMAEIIDQTSALQGHFIKNKDNDLNATKRLTAAQEDLRAKMGEGLLPIKVKLLEVMNTTVQWITANTDKLYNWGMAALSVAGILMSLYVAAKTISTISGLYTAVSGAVKILRNSTLLATIAQTAFNLVASISPFGWIGLVIGGIVLLSDRFAGLRDKLMTFFEPIKSVFLKAYEWIYDRVLKPMFGWLEKWFDFKIATPHIEKGGDKAAIDSVPITSSILSGGKKALENKDLGVKKRNDGLVSGQGKEVKNINIRIDKLVESLHINTTTLGMSTNQIKSEIERVLLSAVNEVNYQ